MNGSLPWIGVRVLQCGCNINWYAGEVAPGMWTKCDRVVMCKQHNDEHFEELEKRWLTEPT